MTRCFTEPRTKKYVKGDEIFQEIIQQTWRRIIGFCYKNKTKCSKTASEKVVHKTPEARENLIGNKDTATKACT